ncbi:MAG: hypothetical protein ACC646_11315 [Paracoccaceae bacterium]
MQSNPADHHLTATVLLPYPRAPGKVERPALPVAQIYALAALHEEDAESSVGAPRTVDVFRAMFDRRARREDKIDAFAQRLSRLD